MDTRSSVTGLALAVAMAMMSGIAAADVTVVERLTPEQPPIIASWLGTSGGLPAFSLAGIAASLELGVEMIDLHVQLTADGRHIVFHDGFLNAATDVERVYPEGHPDGPTRAQRGGRDYVDDYTLSELSELRLVLGGATTPHPLATLEEALDLIGDRALVLLSLQRYDPEGLAAILAPRGTEHVLVYSQDPSVTAEVMAKTGASGFATLRRTRVFDTNDSLAILNASADILGDGLAVAHLDSASRLTPDLEARAGDLGVALSVSGIGKEDFALGDKGDTSAWIEALGRGASVYWTTFPAEVMALVPR